MKSMSINALLSNVTIRRVSVKRNQIQGRPKTNNKKRLSLETVLQNKFENSVRKSHPSHFMSCRGEFLFEHNKTCNWLNDWNWIQTHFLSFVLYIRFYTTPSIYMPKKNAFLLYNRIKEKSKSQKLLLFSSLWSHKTKSAMCASFGP